ncbi:putative D-beta-hydroxybutyrate dehydrogenase, mitochondrial-like isoform X2 [Balamuthia mandrillaris]
MMYVHGRAYWPSEHLDPPSNSTQQQRQQQHHHASSFSPASPSAMADSLGPVDKYLQTSVPGLPLYDDLKGTTLMKPQQPQQQQPVSVSSQQADDRNSFSLFPDEFPTISSGPEVPDFYWASANAPFNQQDDFIYSQEQLFGFGAFGEDLALEKPWKKAAASPYPPPPQPQQRLAPAAPPPLPLDLASPHKEFYPVESYYYHPSPQPPLPQGTPSSCSHKRKSPSPPPSLSPPASENQRATKKRSHAAATTKSEAPSAAKDPQLTPEDLRRELERIEQDTTLSEKEKRQQRRLMKNRQAARQFRKRQKGHIKELEARVKDLGTDNKTLNSRLELLVTENKLMKEQLEYMRSFVLKALQTSSHPALGPSLGASLLPLVSSTSSSSSPYSTSTEAVAPSSRGYYSNTRPSSSMTSPS